jgi:hypothetical protein
MWRRLGCKSKGVNFLGSSKPDKPRMLSKANLDAKARKARRELSWKLKAKQAANVV